MKDTYFDLLCDKIEKEYNEYIAELKKAVLKIYFIVVMKK